MFNAVLITVASWEERFVLGLEQSLSKESFSNVMCLASLRYSEQTATHRKEARQHAIDIGVAFTELLFDFEDQVKCYHQMVSLAQDECLVTADRIVLDVSTAPRTLVWMLLGALAPANREVVIRYSQAGKYGAWQTTEEGEPRLIINRSGIMYPDKPTCLIMLCGPEISRAEKMFNRFEPRKTLILRDPRAADYGEVKRLPVEYSSAVDDIVFDNTDISKSNLKQLVGLVQPQIETYNVVTASLGPKMGAILLFELSEQYEQVGLSYVISGKHNLSATSGIGRSTDTIIKLGN
jgi:hypothetical protein